MKFLEFAKFRDLLEMARCDDEVGEFVGKLSDFVENFNDEELEQFLNGLARDDGE